MGIKITLPVLLIISLLLAASCEEEKPVKKKKQFSTREQTKPEREPVSKPPNAEPDSNIYKIATEQFKDLGMIIGKAELKTVHQSIDAAGYLEVPNESKAEVRTFIGGYLRTTPLLPGDYVKKGQFLISLENMEYIQLQQDYLQARDKLEYLKAVYERKKILADEQITSLSNKQEAESEYNTALASYTGLRKMLQMININPDKLQAENISSTINLYAPIDGYLAKVNAVEGVFAEQTDVIFEIINTDDLHLELKVYEKDILKVKKGQKISFKLPEANSEHYSGEVFLVEKTIDGADKTVLVYCRINKKYHLPLIVGMYIEAKIHYATYEEFCLPTDAFIREEGDYFVFIEKTVTDDEYVFEKVKVDVGSVNEDCIEIVNESYELIDGKKVLIQGAFDL